MKMTTRELFTDFVGACGCPAGESDDVCHPDKLHEIKSKTNSYAGIGAIQ
jgi:hypothetical protein